MEQTKIGDPWSVLPVKNALYAKECTEVDLSGRNLEDLQSFEFFHNIEVVYLNRNKLQSLAALKPNFRLKRIYACDNQLTDISVTKNFKFLEILLLSNNQLKDLDHLLSFIAKLTFLEQLELDGNPVAEEPRYRLRIIQQMPNLKVLDRHAITLQEKTKAMKLAKAASPAKKKGEAPKKKIRVSEAFSKGERDLYREVKEIKQKREEAKREKLEAEFKASLPREYTGMPEPPLISSLRRKAVDSYSNKLTDTEIDDVEALFKKCDPKNTGSYTVEEFKSIVQKLLQDECNMGKIPLLAGEDSVLRLINLVSGSEAGEDEEDEGKKDKLQWKRICPKLNSIEWKLLSPEELQTRVDKLNAEAKKLLMLGKKEEALEMTTRALHLSGAKDRSKVIEVSGGVKEMEKSRKDVVRLKIPTQVSDQPRLIKTIVNNTQVLAKTKYDLAPVSRSLGQPRHIHMT